MRINQYQKQHKELSLFIQNLVRENSIFVSKLSHGNYSNQVQIHLRRKHNESTTTGDIILFLEIDKCLIEGMNVYERTIIENIKKNLSKEKIMSEFPEWF